MPSQKLEIVLSSRIKKDFKLLQKRGYNFDLLDEVVEMLAHRIVLPPKYKDHLLSGDYTGFRECHIQPDWLLIYKVVENDLYLLLSRSGSHSDLF